MTPSRPVSRYGRVCWSIVAFHFALIGALHGLHVDSGVATTLSAPPIASLDDAAVPAPASEGAVADGPILHCTGDHHPHEAVAGASARLPVRTVTLADGEASAADTVSTEARPTGAIRPRADHRGPAPSVIRLCVQRI
jgi:hypothetical protein